MKKLLLIAVLIGVVLTGCGPSRPTGPRSGTYAETPFVGDQLIFPEGWTPVFMVRETGQAGSAFFVCERDGVYRVCYPRVVQ